MMKIRLMLSLIFCLKISIHAEESTRVFENGPDKLIVYSDVPGLTPSEFYKIRVRSHATDYAWQESFALITRSLVAEAQQESGSDEKYFSHLKDWSHTYTNIEMNAPVEVEISKFDDSPIKKAAIHPISKGRDLKISPDGKVTFIIDEPAQVTIDIDGQMDDQNTGHSEVDGYENNRYDGDPIHAISIFANPVMEKPEASDSSVWVVEPNEIPPTNPDLYTTLYFAPGVHDLDYDFKVYGDREYYIPGDAIVYGTFNNYTIEDGRNIKIYGLGTISGDKIKHPEYHPDFPYTSASPSNAKPWKPISIERAENVLIEGISIMNPAFHAVALPPATNQRKVTFVRWVKIISWRGNGDGIGNAQVIEDSFFRTQDDSTYIKGDRIRCVFWNDANGSSMVLQGISTNYPILVSDCDVIYARAQWHRWNGGRVFSGRPINSPGQKNVRVLFRDVRIEDTRPTLQIFNLHSKDDLPAEFNSPSDDIGESYRGIIFQNITAAASSILDFPEILHGCEASPYSDLTFENVSIAGKLFTETDDFAFVNEWVTDIRFNPAITDDATLFDVYVDGVSLPNFAPDTENYSIDLPADAELPVVTATQLDYDATLSISQAKRPSYTTEITVTAEDGVTSKTYSIHWGGAADTKQTFTLLINQPGETPLELTVAGIDLVCDLQAQVASALEIPENGFHLLLNSANISSSPDASLASLGITVSSSLDLAPVDAGLTYAVYADGVFNPGTENVGPWDDFDEDGMLNFIEYALGRNLLSGHTEGDIGLFTLRPRDTSVFLRWTQREGIRDAVMLPEISRDLQYWSIAEGTDFVETIHPVGQEGVQEIRWDYQGSLMDGLFFRVSLLLEE